MASVTVDSEGRRRIQFAGVDGKRRTIRLGSMNAKGAEHVKMRVETILAAQLGRVPVEADTAKWLGDIPDTLHQRLLRVGLAEPRARREAVTLGELLTAFFAGVAVKPATFVRMQQAQASLLRHFSESKPVDSIDEADAQEWRAKLKEAGYAEATISRTVLYARQVFRWGIKRGMAKANPFGELKAGAQVNHARAVFIDRETIAKVLESAPDAEWRLLIVLSRFCGLRVPSEALALTWADVDWHRSALRVRSPKTEHHEGRGERTVPIFPEVLPYLREVYEAAPEETEKVFQRYQTGANLNPQFRRIIEKAGLRPWERTWHNMRASRQTELASEFPLHTVCAWIGNTKAIAQGHYLQLTDADWQRATKGAGTRDAKSDARATQNPDAAGIRTGSRRLGDPRRKACAFRGFR